MNREAPYINQDNVGILAQLTNRLVASFDVTELSDEEALEVFLLFTHFMTMVWETHESVLLPVFKAFMQDHRIFEDDDPEDDI